MLLPIVISLIICASAAQEVEESDGDVSRKILGSSVVTSVSVVMDAGSRNQTHFTDAAGKPVSKPSIASHIASPINLLNPDRYEFFTFDDNGELVKRLMTLEEIQGIIASGDGEEASYDSAGTYLPEKKVEDILNNVQNVLKEKMESHKNSTEVPVLDTPDVSSTWNMILPVIFGNQNDSLNPEKQQVLVTVDDPVHKPITIGHRPIFQQKPSKVAQQETPISGNVKGSEKIEVTTPIVKDKTPQPTTPQQDLDTPIISVSIISDKKPDNVKGEMEDSSPIIAIKPTTTSTEMVPDILESTKNMDVPSNKTPVVSQKKTTTPPIVQEVSTTTKVALSSNLPSHNLEDLMETTTLDTSPVTEEQIDSKQPASNVKDSITHENSAVDIISYSTLLQPPEHDLNDLVRRNYSTLTPPSPSPSVPSPFTLKDVQSNQFSTQAIEAASNTTYEVIKEITTRKSTTSSLYEDFTLPVRGEISSISPGFKENVHETTTEQLPTAAKISTSTQNVQEELESSASTSFTNIEGKGKFTTPLLIIIKENVQGNKKPLETSTQSLLSTFFFINSVQGQTTKSIGTSTESDNVKTTTYKSEENDENGEKDKNTTIYDKVDFDVDSNKDVVEDLNQNKETTSVKQTLDELVTSTLVDDINIEFSSLGSTAIDEDVSQPSLKYSHATQPYLDTTTERNLISSIDQLISQAMTNTEEFVNDKLMGERIEDLLNNMTEKPMQQVQSEAMTVASSLLNTEQSVGTTQENQLENDQLSEAVSSLLSQVYGVEQGVLTTVEDFTTTTNSWLNVDQTTVNSVKETVNDSVLINVGHKQNGMIGENATKEQTYELQSSKKEDELMKEDSKTTTENVGEVFYTKINDMLIEINNTAGDTEAQAEITESQAEFTDLSNDNTNFEQSQTFNITDYKSGSEFETKPISTEVTTELNKVTISFVPETDTEFVQTTQRDNVEVNTKKENGKITTLNDLKEQESHSSTSFDKLEISSSTPIEWIHLTNSEAEVKNESTQAPSTEKVFFETHSTEVPVKTSLQSFETSASTKLPTTTKIPTTTEVNSIKESDSNVWTLVSTVLPHSSPPPPTTDHMIVQTPPPIKLNLAQSPGLQDSISSLDTDVHKFIQLCNELSFGFWDAVTTGISSARSVFVSPFATTSLLAMIFLGAKGATSNEMNEILQLDDMVTFNPHLIFKNVTESIMTGGISGVATSVLIRELYSDVNKGKLLNFYKERARFFYDGYVEEVNFREIGDIIRRRTNLLVKKYTSGKIQEYLKDSSIKMRTPLAGFSSSIYQTDCSSASTDGRDGELHFIVFPSLRQRRLIPIPAAVYRSHFLAGYDPILDATVAAVGESNQILSTIFVIPGQQGIAAPGDGLNRLERELLDTSYKSGSWARLLSTLIPRPGLELQIPKFSHKSIINATVALRSMGLRGLFSYDKADLRGLNGIAHDFHLSDILQVNTFTTCGERTVGEHHHKEIYPATAKRSRKSRRLDYFEGSKIYRETDILEEPRDYQRAFHDPLHDPDLLSLPLPLRPRQARIPDPPRLRFDRPFLFFIRHNPTGLILHMGRFNPRLLP